MNNINDIRTKLHFRIILFFVFVSSLNNLRAQAPLTKDYIDEFSASSCFIIGLNHNNKPIFSATGFIAKFNHSRYLITNNHVVGGKYAQDEYLKLHGHPIPSDSLPDVLSIRLYGQYLGQSEQIKIHLKDRRGKTWVQFYENDNDSATLLDVVAIPIIAQPEITFTFTRTLDSTAINRDILLYPGCELFVVGFPFGYGYKIYPIWKRATIGSEFDLLQVGLSSFFIDATTRQGMSGSPVYFRGTTLNSKSGGLENFDRPVTYLVGIYSAQSEMAELGTVIRLDNVFTKLSQMNSY